MKLSHLSLLIMLLMVGSGFRAGAMDGPVFENPSRVKSESGYLKLSWTWPGVDIDRADYSFQLQQSWDTAFVQHKLIYEGRDLATFLSGLEDGIYFFRVRGNSDRGFSTWSPVVRLEVAHHSLTLAFTLFGLGAIVFLLTVGIVIHGDRKLSRNQT